MNPTSEADGPRVVRRPGALSEIAAIVSGWGCQRALLLCGPSRRHVEVVAAQLPSLDHAVFDAARVHVPAEVVEAARARMGEFGPDLVIAVGGGAAIGLGKMLRRDADVRLLAVPTTFSGSEMTAIWGTTEDGEKVTGRDPRVRPEVVIHDAWLAFGMPADLAVASGLNALAHPISALSTGALEGVARAEALAAVAILHPAIGALAKSDSAATHDRMFEGVALAGRVIDRGGLGTHHRIVHLLGGRFGLSHSGLHSVLLPHSTARLRADAALWAALRTAAISEAPDVEMMRALEAAGAPTSLRALGLGDAQLADVTPALDALGDGVADWVAAAQRGDPPGV